MLFLKKEGSYQNKDSTAQRKSNKKYRFSGTNDVTVKPGRYRGSNLIFRPKMVSLTEIKEWSFPILGNGTNRK
jgi:hypothetical protein